jgi:hypothetical protein
MKKKKIEILLFSLIILLSIFLLNFFLKNNLAHKISSYYTKISYSFFVLRNFLNNSLEKDSINYTVKLFDENLQLLTPLSFTFDGIYFYKIEDPGLVITTDKKFVGIAESTGKFVFIKKWWYDTINVTVETEKFETEAIIRNGKLEIEDNISINFGKVFLSKYFPYSFLLYEENIFLGEIKNGIFIKNIPDVTFKTKFLLLKNYLIKK